MDVPYTVNGRVVWRSEPCTATLMRGSKFCLWHHESDFLRQDGRRGLGSVLNLTTAEAKYNL